MAAYATDDSWRAIAAKFSVVLYMFYPAYYLIQECNPWYMYFEYLTVWGWTLIHFYFFYSLCLDLHGKMSPNRLSSDAFPRVAAQALSEVGFAASVVITSLFWFIIYPQERWRSVSFEIHMHGVGLCLMIVDYLYRFTGFHMRNHRYIMSFAGAYYVIHVALVKYRRQPIYPGIDFQGPFSFVLSIVGLSVMIATHKLVYLCHHWRVVKEKWKTAIGITQYFLMPRQNSHQYLMELTDDEDTNEFPIAATGGQEVGRKGI